MAYDKRRIEKSQYVLGVKPSTLDAPIAAQAGDEPLTERDIADLRNVIAVAERGRMPDLAAKARAMLDSGVLPARAAGKIAQAGDEPMRQALQVCVKALEFRKERSANDEFALNLARIALAGSPRSTSPVDVILHCPRCHTQHIDTPSEGWANPPHRSHLCHHCGCVWRPADIETNGVERIATVGKLDTPL